MFKERPVWAWTAILIMECRTFGVLDVYKDNLWKCVLTIKSYHCVDVKFTILYVTLYIISNLRNKIQDIVKTPKLTAIV